MSLEQGIAGGASGAPSLASLRARQRGDVATAAFWLLGCAVVVAAQPGFDRRLAAVGAAAAGLATIVAVTVLTQDPARRYFRSLVGTMVVVAVVATWLLRLLIGITNSFRIAGLNTRITLPLMFVLFAPLVVRALPAELRSPPKLWRSARSPAELWGRASTMDRIIGASATVVLLPALVVGVVHGNRVTYVAQDLGLMVFFVLMYIAGRCVTARVAREAAGEFVDVLLLFAIVTYVLFGWNAQPLYEYIQAACAGALAFALLRPRKVRLLPLGTALAILVAMAVSMANGAGSSETNIDLVGAILVLGYVVVRLKPLVPQWAIAGAAAVALVCFIGLTSNGATVRGQYHGRDLSNVGRTFEAQRVRAAVRHSPVSLVFGRGLGGTIDETGAPPAFATALAGAGRDLSHVQEVHLLEYNVLLKEGFLGILWLAAFGIGLIVLVARALDKAAREHDPSLVIYAALPLLSFAAAFAAATHLQNNPLNAFTIGILVTCLARGRNEASPAGS